MKKFIRVEKPKVLKTISIRAYQKSSNKVVPAQCSTIGKLQKQLDKLNLQCSPPFESLLFVSYDRADRKGTWSWGVNRDWTCCSVSNPIITTFYTNYHNKKTWREILNEKKGTKRKGEKKRHKFYPVQELKTEAINRISAIEFDDYEEIFRFGLRDKFRFYGFTYGNVFLAVWHDPNHDIYGGKKKK